MAEFRSLLGDANRLQIVSLLAERELCVKDLATAIDMSESVVSHQLRTLTSIRLVSYHKPGRHAFNHLQNQPVFSLYQAVGKPLGKSMGFSC